MTGLDNGLDLESFLLLMRADLGHGRCWGWEPWSSG